MLLIVYACGMQWQLGERTGGTPDDVWKWVFARLLYLFVELSVQVSKREGLTDQIQSL